MRQSLWLLFGSVTLLLLIACTNIAALLLARTSEREHEISVRISLGASRTNVIAQLLSEVFVLALLGSALGLGLAAGAAKLFRSWPAICRVSMRSGSTLTPLPTLSFPPSWSLFSAACCPQSAAPAGVSPVHWRIPAASRCLRAIPCSGRWSVSRSRSPLRFLVGAGLLLRSFQQLARVAPGFDVEPHTDACVSAPHGPRPPT